MVQSGIDPNALDHEPDPDPYLDWVFTAFRRLSTCRSMGMAAGHIPWTAITAYAASCGIEDEDEVDDFVDLIIAMDGEYLKPKDHKGGN
ncbi:hypothetical protein [Azospirillum sp. TSA6c]|uniref:phage tail assembly chaperone n=1 Tax=Azospirillum sp. TSA6c TaxID=709813 RepID=UPI000D65BD5E|nr:hypothetical protein [Azospirillum sp. TSA6c]